MKTKSDKLIRYIKGCMQDGEFFTKYGTDKWVVIDRKEFDEILKKIKELE